MHLFTTLTHFLLLPLALGLPALESYPKKPAIVLVHGAWVTRAFWNVTTSALRSSGYRDIVTPEFISNHIIEPPTATHRDDVALVQKELKKLVDAGRDIVVVMHSYGGLVGSDSIEGFVKKAGSSKGGVVAAVYHTAFIVEPGNNVLGSFGDGPSPDFIVPHPGNDAYFDVQNPRDVFFNDLSDADAAHWLPDIRSAAAGTFTSNAQYAPWKDVPCAYLFATVDNAIPPAAQHAFFDNVQAESKFAWVTGEVKGGHASAISHAGDVASFIDTVARK
ncbi:alpha/beta-hydrolase [Pseudovirgaria hyperparasitica]|uniref:Alpha/beta-hydrolase n=1 Tax=Pseudovirgaria hyperparasitica TaxID=470096 RepID=A0A6A6WA92_9PEZI|nr:alpha/beta-hydrolase [Pseudovirgaria hyperparasitica]KAF2758031.1 alpha/beta-hydrolase [Pseudovirgaria hyperparasitica]